MTHSFAIPCSLLVAAIGIAAPCCARAEDPSSVAETLEEAHRLFWTAHAAREAGDLQTASEAAERAVVLNPGSAYTWYLAGHIALDRGERNRGAECFEEVVALGPTSPLGEAASEHLEYLAWLDTSEQARAAILSGDRETARQALRDLSVHSDSAIAADASLALEALDHSGTRAAHWGGSAGSVLDSNPLYVSESVRDRAAVAGVGFTVGMWGAVPLLDRQGLRVVAAGSGLARSYAAGPDGADYSRLRAALEITADQGSWTAWIGVDAGLATLGWRPLLDLERLKLGLSREVAPSHVAGFRGVVLRRGAHLEGYGNLAAHGASGEVAWTWTPARTLDLSLSWSLAGESAVPYEVRWSLPEADGGGTLTVEADASFVGHGPRLHLSFDPGWHSVEFDLGASLQWRAYSRAERATQHQGGLSEVVARDRRDVRWGADLTASVEVRRPLRALVSLTTGHNASTLDGQDWAIDRSFRRSLWVAGLEVRQ